MKCVQYVRKWTAATEIKSKTTINTIFREKFVVQKWQYLKIHRNRTENTEFREA